MHNSHLLTHTAGFGTDRSDPLLTRWRESRGESLNRRNMTLVQGALKPLLFEPGTGWSYGTSTDWAGLLVMRLNDMSLEAYMQKYIWDPLGIRDITFHQELKPEVRKHLVTMTTRGRQALYSTAVKTEDKVQWTEEKLYDDPIPHESGSGGAIGSAVEFSKILHSINADDGRLLMSETIDDMFTPQLEGEVLAKFIETREPLAADGMFTAHKPGEKLQYGLAGMIVLDDTDTGLKAGTLTWSGLPTLLWTIDMESGLSLMYASNIVPFGDLKSHKMQQLFEKEMYKRLLEV
jgi:CubicO group peptidase (beta-lactamase class C family)